jgi:hypothetical protein
MENWNVLIADVVLSKYQTPFYAETKLKKHAEEFYKILVNELHRDLDGWNGKMPYPPMYDVAIRLFSMEPAERVITWSKIDDFFATKQGQVTDEDVEELKDELQKSLDSNFDFLNTVRGLGPGQKEAEPIESGEEVSPADKNAKENAVKRRKKKPGKGQEGDDSFVGAGFGSAMLSEEVSLSDDPSQAQPKISNQDKAEKIIAIWNLMADVNKSKNAIRQTALAQSLREDLNKGDDFSKFVDTICQVKNAEDNVAAVKAITDFVASGSAEGLAPMDVEDESPGSNCVETFPKTFSNEQISTLESICESAKSDGFVIAPVHDLDALQEMSKGKLRGIVQEFKLNMTIASKEICDIDAGVMLANNDDIKESKVWAAVKDTDTGKILGFIALVERTSTEQEKLLVIQQICAVDSSVASHLLAYALAYMSDQKVEMVIAQLPILQAPLQEYMAELSPKFANDVNAKSLDTIIGVAQTKVACWYFSFGFKSIFPLELLSKKDGKGASVDSLRDRLLTQSPRPEIPNAFAKKSKIFEPMERWVVMPKYPDFERILEMSTIKPECDVVVRQPASKRLAVGQPESE